MQAETDQTLNEPRYKLLGGNGNDDVPWYEDAMNVAIRQVEREDIAGRLLKLSEAEFMSMELLKDDAGWQRLSDASNLDMPDALRVGIVHRARQYARHDGIVKQTVSLYTNFGVGTGFAGTVNEEHEAAATTLNAFIKSPANRQIFSTQGQRNSSKALLTDGEIFFVLFPSDPMKIRTIDPLEIVAVATNPEDKSEPRIYIRKYYVGSQEHTKLYRDWMWDGEGGAATAQGKLVTGDLEDAVIYHVKLAGRGLRGESGLIADMDWAKQYRKFMTGRAAVVRAIAMFAAKLKMQTDAAGLAAAATQLGTGLSQSTSETNPPPVSGSTMLENAGATYSTVRQETGAASAKVDSELFMQQATCGSGMFPHYYGLGNSFRLATAASMEPPMFKAFTAYQELWRDAYELIFQYVLEQANVPDEQCVVNVKGQPIREQDIGPLIDGIEKTVRTFSTLAASDDIAKYALTLLGISKPDEVLGQLAETYKDVPGHNVAALVYGYLREVVKQGGVQEG